MKIRLDKLSFNEGLKTLKSEYKILAPVTIPFKGTYSDTDITKYEEITTIEEVELNKKSNFSAKEVILPINQVLFYFTEKEYKESDVDNKKLLVFLRACDLNGIKRLDEIYLRNGVEKDYYYERLREKVKFVLIGCKESFRNCFCVSMGTSKSDDYSMALNIRQDEIYLDIKDEELNVFNGKDCNFEVDFVKKNTISVEVPEISNLVELSKNSIWEDYDQRCIACGRCNFVCPTCSCFTMQDIYYKENENVGERRRVWASCQVDGYTDMAGGHSFRNNKGERMRFKVMHKIHDFNKRFGYHMCVGCGRCDDACPQYISFSECIDKINNIVAVKEEVK
ncbi:anaerobic sulfite reductase subunit AsrA [Romboutsia ilealis]|uniref:Anaerobic sulfite reductase subunit AsrA n=1 Tax=Romboutsia faecis TaxID=2764597 RepID=A0ABR7JNH1_9FIRM|nr:anaerobic sulfite reductase subunit AsrA [Romboutsia faecis]MBC5996141.1 anaerobic sulfite reductase subunit AsrA [Romboutsia faecis]MRN23341.1 anaerobic sulfite reductase subunit AsrA [Romboutsia ilealis]